jgi:N-acetylneuraminate synthase
MVEVTRQLERALGRGVKAVEVNEEDTVIIQRRSIRANKKLMAGVQFTSEDAVILRPCPQGAL